MPEVPNRIVRYVEGVPPPSDEHILVDVIPDGFEDGDDEDDHESPFTGSYWVLPEHLNLRTFKDEDTGKVERQIRWVYRHLGEHIDWAPTLEQFELHLMRGENLAVDVWSWVQATYAYIHYVHCEDATTHFDQDRVFKAVHKLLHGNYDQIEDKELAVWLLEAYADTPEEMQYPDNFTEDGYWEHDLDRFR